MRRELATSTASESELPPAVSHRPGEQPNHQSGAKFKSCSRCHAEVKQHKAGSRKRQEYISFLPLHYSCGGENQKRIKSHQVLPLIRALTVVSGMEEWTPSKKIVKLTVSCGLADCKTRDFVGFFFFFLLSQSPALESSHASKITVFLSQSKTFYLFQKKISCVSVLLSSTFPRGRGLTAALYPSWTREPYDCPGVSGDVGSQPEVGTTFPMPSGSGRAGGWGLDDGAH